MFDFNLFVLADLAKNPLFIAALIGIFRNIGGYLFNCFRAKTILPYDIKQFLATLVFFETTLVILVGVAGLPVDTAVIVAMVLDFIRSLKTALENPDV